MSITRFGIILIIFVLGSHFSARSEISLCPSYYSSFPSRLLRIENRLAQGTIDSDTPVIEGNYGARYVTYRVGTPGVWKSNSFAGPDGSYNDGNAEIASYKIDRFLSLNKVPPTVAKEYKGKAGTVQLRVHFLKTLPENREYVPSPPELGFFDFLIGNGDRNPGNILERQDGSIVAIDHGGAFGTKKSHALFEFNEKYSRLVSALEKQRRLEPLLLAATTREKQAALSEEIANAVKDQRESLSYVQAFFPSKKVIEKLRSTTFDDWKNLVGDHLTDVQIHQMMERQSELLKKVDEVEATLGTQQVYPKVRKRRELQTRPKRSHFFF